MTDASQVPTGRPAVLALVKREGPIAADALAVHLQLTPTAVRQHLQALSQEGLVAEARDVGVTEFLSKPVTARGVIERITRVVEHPRPFVKTTSYFGPDRRRRDDPNYPGPYRRLADKPSAAIDD
jgi:DNA-binding transcriptional ArsR family regulator